METDRMLADVADAAARRDDVAVRSPVGVDHLRRARRGRSESRSRRRRRRTGKIRRNPVSPRRVAVTAAVVAALRPLAEAARETQAARVLVAVALRPHAEAARETETARVLAAVVAAAALRPLAEAARETETARVLAAVVAAAALRPLAEAARETERARVLAAVVAAVPTDREAAFDPGVRVVTAAARARCVAGAPAGDAARRRTVEAANDAAGVGAPNAGEVAVAAAVLRG